MIGNTVDFSQALFISISSILVVFTVLFILFIAVKLFGKILSDKNSDCSSGRELLPQTEEDGDELAAVAMAAIKLYEAEKRINPMIRTRPKRLYSRIVSHNSMARNCRHDSV